MSKSTGAISNSFALAAGSATTTLEIQGGFSHAQVLTLDISLTGKGGATAADTLNIYFQDTMDRVRWNDRIATAQVLGSVTVSATAPKAYRYQIQNEIPVALDEEAYELTESAGARLTANTVANGSFPGKFRDATGWKPNWRLQFVVVDADSSSAFSGNWTLTPTSDQ